MKLFPDSSRETMTSPWITVFFDKKDVETYQKTLGRETAEIYEVDTSGLVEEEKYLVERDEVPKKLGPKRLKSELLTLHKIPKGAIKGGCKELSCTKQQASNTNLGTEGELLVGFELA